jgi:hypothetical protein
MVEIERLGDVIVSTELDRLDRHVRRAVGGHDDDRQALALLLRLAQHIEAGFLRHPHVHQDQIGALLRERRLDLQPVGRLADREPSPSRNSRRSSRIASSSSAIKMCGMNTSILRL